LPDFLQLCALKERLAARSALRPCNHVMFGEVKEVLTFRTAAALRLLVQGWVHIDQDEAIVQRLDYLLGCEGLPALRTLRAFVFRLAACRRAGLVFYWRQTQSHDFPPFALGQVLHPFVCLGGEELARASLRCGGQGLESLVEPQSSTRPETAPGRCKRLFFLVLVLAVDE
jgi:hypothetical protein